MRRACSLAAVTAPSRGGYCAIRSKALSSSVPTTYGSTNGPATGSNRASTSDSPSKGVYRESESADINALVNNFTAPAIARALRERESSLQKAAVLAQSGNYAELKLLLTPFLQASVEKRRVHNHELELSRGFKRKDLVIIQRYLSRMPRFVFQAATKRASVVIPLVRLMLMNNASHICILL